MTINHFLIVGLGPPNQRRNAPTLKSDSNSGNRRIEFTIDGRSQRYDNVPNCYVTERDNIQLWYVDVGLGSTSYLSIALSNSSQGTFYLGDNRFDQPDMGLVTYASNHSIYSSYGSMTWTATKPMLSHGHVHVERSKQNKMAELTFSALLVSLAFNGNTTRLAPISGHVVLQRP